MTKELLATDELDAILHALPPELVQRVPVASGAFQPTKWRQDALALVIGAAARTTRDKFPWFARTRSTRSTSSERRGEASSAAPRHPVQLEALQLDVSGRGVEERGGQAPAFLG